MAKKQDKNRVEIIDTILKPHLLQEPLKRAIGADLHALGDYHDGIPMAEIREVLKKHGLVLLQEDQTVYSGIFCGAKGSSLIEVGFEYTCHKGNFNIDTYIPLKNSALSISWYKMNTRTEVICYMS